MKIAFQTMQKLHVVGNNDLKDNLSAVLNYTNYIALNLAHKLPITHETMVMLPSAEQQSAFKPTYDAYKVQLLHWR